MNQTEGCTKSRELPQKAEGCDASEEFLLVPVLCSCGLPITDLSEKKQRQKYYNLHKENRSTCTTLVLKHAKHPKK
jgi:hypothetical protein